MKRTHDLSWWALMVSLVLVGVARWWTSHATPAGRSGASAVRPAVAGVGNSPLPSPDLEGWVRHARAPRGLPDARAYTTGIVETIRITSDPAASRVLGWVESSLPPGWQDTFVLHDALVVSGALTDMARVISFASSEGLEERPREALKGEALRMQGIADDVARRWLSAKYPLMGTNAIEHILRESNREVLPLLGPYNIVGEEESIRLLAVPSAAE